MDYRRQGRLLVRLPDLDQLARRHHEVHRPRPRRLALVEQGFRLRADAPRLEVVELADDGVELVPALQLQLRLREQALPGVVLGGEDVDAAVVALLLAQLWFREP